MAGRANAVDRVLESIEACVPAHGYADVTLSTPAHSRIYGDLRNAATFARVSVAYQPANAGPSGIR